MYRWNKLFLVLLTYGALGITNVAQATIKINQAMMQNGAAVVSGNGATKGAQIFWEGFAVTKANKTNGGFSFVGIVPADCSGALSDGSSTVLVAVLGCTVDSCQADLATCTTNLSSSQSQLSSCTTDKTTCTTNLKTCTTDNTTCTENLTTCQTDLAACEAEPVVIFPGDGQGHGPGLKYTVNSDETFTDTNTGFQWETKLAASHASCTDATQANRDPHCVNNEYTFAEAGAWVAALNTANFAGHSDWRLPNVKELQSIVDYSKSNPATSVPGVTIASFYWSSTATAGNPAFAWGVNFSNGNVDFDGKSFSYVARAVRGAQGPFEPPPPPICDSNSQCAVGEYCLNGQCEETAVCTNDGQCPSGQTCDEPRSTCIPSPPPPACSTVTDQASCEARPDCRAVIGGTNCHRSDGTTCQSGEINCVCEPPFVFQACMPR